MKITTKTLSVLCTALGLLVAVPATVRAEDWTAAQKDVLKSVEAYWAADAAGNTDEFMSYFDADYVGWGNSFPLPESKSTAKKFISHGHKSGKTLVYDVHPIAIKI